CGNQFAGRYDAVRRQPSYFVQRTMEYQSLPPLVSRQIPVARTHGQAVRLADDGANYDFHWEVQFADHFLQDGDLRRVLLPEERLVRPDDMEELRHHRRHAAKVPRARSPIQPPAHAFHIDEGARAGRVHLLGRWREHQIHAFTLQSGAVGFKGSRILGEILIWAELGRVHENGDDNRSACRPGRTDQGQMPLMQCAHRRHKPDALAAGPHCAERGPCLGYGWQNLQCTSKWWRKNLPFSYVLMDLEQASGCSSQQTK